MSEFELPNTRYALSGDVNIAFQVMGDGPIDIILVPGIVSHVEFLHEFPGYTRVSAPSREVCPRRDVRQARPGVIGRNIGSALA